ncbi:hypothetical protein TNCV_2844951 [Trichonephila clavipes]|nr:hypothetical protein TNCV_2844951 [Trichonephila clavipes]
MIVNFATERNLVRDQNDNLRNPLRTPSAGNAISAIKLFTFFAKILIIEPVLPCILEECGFQRIFLNESNKEVRSIGFLRSNVMLRGGTVPNLRRQEAPWRIPKKGDESKEAAD